MNFWKVVLRCLMCSASAPFPSLSVILVIWLSGFIAVPFSIVPLIILILMDFVSILSGTIISREICLTPLISKESDELTVLDKSFDQDPQGYGQWYHGMRNIGLQIVDSTTLARASGTSDSS
jgi:hypothetical protein